MILCVSNEVPQSHGQAAAAMHLFLADADEVKGLGDFNLKELLSHQACDHGRGLCFL